MANTALVQIIAVGGLPFELRNDVHSERWNIYKEARNSIKRNNVPDMSLDEINAEISAARERKAFPQKPFVVTPAELVEILKEEID